MLILAIETSCDETAVAIIENGTKVISSSIASSREITEKYGGVVPEIAARKQVDFIVPVIKETLEKAWSGSPVENLQKVDAFAVTVGPGLIGSLIVGVEAAKTLSLVANKPLIPVNHLVGHIYANWIASEIPPEFPALALVVSGGHTDLVLMKAHGNLTYLGGTLDDAAGEAFDKTARLLGLSKYFGGPIISERAAQCKENTLADRLPRPKISDKDFDFSFSGLKTAVRRVVETEFPAVDVVACEFENAVCDVLVKKTIRAAHTYKVKSLLLGGGVAANTQLRTRLRAEAEGLRIKIFIPEISLCTDTAVYIGSAAFFNNKPASLDAIKVNPSLTIVPELSTL